MQQTARTAWDDPAFVSAWNETYGMDMRNAPIRPGTVYPWLAEQVKDFTGKKLIDIGCGNGNLIHHFRNAGFREWHGIDSGSEVIKSAISHVVRPDVTFTHFNPAEPFPYEQTGRDYDVATAIFVLEEIPNPAFPQFCRTVSNLLRTGGKALIFSNHPVNILREDMLRAANSDHPVKFEGLDGYFDRDPSTYSLSVLNQTNNVAKKTPYHHKTLSDILNGFSRAGLCLNDTIEVPLGVTNITEMKERKPQQGDAPRFIGLSFEKLTT